MERAAVAAAPAPAVIETYSQAYARKQMEKAAVAAAPAVTAAPAAVIAPATTSWKSLVYNYTLGMLPGLRK